MKTIISPWQALVHARSSMDSRSATLAKANPAKTIVVLCLVDLMSPYLGKLRSPLQLRPKPPLASLTKPPPGIVVVGVDEPAV